MTEDNFSAGGGDGAQANGEGRFRGKRRRTTKRGEPNLETVLYDAATGRGRHTPLPPREDTGNWQNRNGQPRGQQTRNRGDQGQNPGGNRANHKANNHNRGQNNGSERGNAPGRNRQTGFGNQDSHGGKQGGRGMRRVRPPGREHEHLPPYAEQERLAETWWANRWLNVLHRFGWKGRLANGRLYANEGRVSERIETGRILAKVRGSRTQPYDVTIQIKPLIDADWDLIVDILSCQALFTAQLLAGEMPQDIEEVFDAAYAPLFPRSKDDIKAHCTCPDWANPCKHIAAVYYAMADAFDKDPFLLFALRGRTRDQLIGMLRAARSADARSAPMVIEALDAGALEPFRFWQAGEELDGVHVTIAEPPFPGATAKRLGRPPFWRSPADPITRLSEVYEAIARRAREVALNEPTLTGGAVIARHPVPTPVKRP